MRFCPRKSTPKVRDGKVQRKNRSAETPNYWNTIQEMPVIDRRRPGRDRRHILMKRDIVNFIRLLPDWPELSKGLNAIVLDEGGPGAAGEYVSRSGVITISSWNRDLWEDVKVGFFEEHQAIYERIGLDYEPDDWSKPQRYTLKWTEAQIRAYQLVHILLHELGHHHDRMTTRSRLRSARGEGYAEEYAIKYLDLIWQRYLKAFDPQGQHHQGR